MSDVLCNVCDAAAVVTACSSLGPMSLSYCQLCWELGCEPYEMTVNFCALSGIKQIENLATHFHKILFATISRANKSVEDFWEDVKNSSQKSEIN